MHTPTAASLRDIKAMRRVPPTPGFAIADHVLIAALRWPLRLGTNPDDGITRWICDGTATCYQGLIPVCARDGRQWHHHPEQAAGLTLAHLIQVHGWTREDVGDE